MKRVIRPRVEEPPDDDLDADFEDCSDGKKKTPLKPSSKPASKVTVVNNQEAPMGSLLKHPPGWTKTKAAKATAMAATTKNNLSVDTPVSNDYSQLVASSAAIAASI
jgi:hypothetical protein